MSKAWIIAKLPEFVRDMFRNFCQAMTTMEEQFRTFDRGQPVSFDVLRELIGSERDKGLLWRLKDTAHHVFRNDPELPMTGRFLDWSLGYVFHECIKLMEDSYQRRNYGPWLKELRDGALDPYEADIVEPFIHVPDQTDESMRREIDRIRLIMSRCKRLLPIYLSRHSDNELLARFIFAQQDLVNRAFEDDYPNLIRGIYREHPENMYILASRSLRLGGWIKEAALAADRAMELDNTSAEALEEWKAVDKIILQSGS